MLPSDQTYLNWQVKLKTSNIFRWFWEFWAIYSVVLLAGVGLYFLAQQNWPPLILSASAFLISRYGLSPAIYVFYKKRRPYQRLGFRTIHSWLMSTYKTIPNSFPSDHAVGIASILVVWTFFAPGLIWVFVLLAVLNGMARIILGYHDVYDVVAGWIVGAAAALATLYAFLVFW